MFVRWKGAMEIRGLRMNMEKTKLIVGGASGTEALQLGSYPVVCVVEEQELTLFFANRNSAIGGVTRDAAGYAV